MAALWDPHKMTEAKASFRHQMRFVRYLVALLLIGAAYWIGYETGQVQAIQATCRDWLRR